MKRIVFLTWLILVASPLVMAQAKKPVSKDGLINSHVKSFFEAVKTNDYEKLKAFYTADYTFTGLDGKMVTAEGRVGGFKAQGGSNFIEATDLAIRLYGDSAVVTGIAVTKTPSGGTEKARFLQVWVTQDMNYRLVASQATKIE